MKLEFGAGEGLNLDFNLGKVIRQIIIKQFLEKLFKKICISVRNLDRYWTDKHTKFF